MVFAPKLEGGGAYNQPVQTPNALSAVAGLFDFGLSALKASSSGETRLTEDEKFAVAVREFEADKGGTFTWDRKGMREFIFKYPQFTSQAKSYGENLGIMTADPIEQSRDAVLDWAQTPEGIMASAVASGMPEEEGTAYLSEQFTRQKQQEAEIAKLTRNASQYEAEGTLFSKQWDALKPAQKDLVDSTVQTVVGPIVTEVMNGVTVEIPQEIQAMLGIRYSTVDMSNLPALLNDAKIALGNNARKTYTGNFGVDTLPSDQWNKEVFASLDALIEIGKSIDTPQERASAMEALIQTETYKRLDGAGAAVAIAIFKTLPPDVAELLFPDVTNVVGKLSGVIAPETGGSLFPTKTIAGNVSKTSTTEAEALAVESLSIIEKGITPEFFTVFKEAAKRTGYNVVDANTFKSIVGNNIPEIVRLTGQNPEFREEFGGFLTSDIQMTISTFNESLPTGLALSLENGKFRVTTTEDFNSAGFAAVNKVRTNGGQQPITIDQYIADSLAKLDGGFTLEDLNQKVSSLGLLGEFGKEIQGALGLLNKQPTDTRARGKSRGGSSSSSSSSSSGKGKDIGAALGIDFAKYEQDNNLPSGYLNKVAMIESGGNPNADNPNSTAGGLFQQIDANAAQYGVTNKYDAVQSTEGAVRFAVDNMNYLTSVLGREPTGGELYLAHQQGPGGAARLLANPDAKAVDIVGADAIRLNGGNINMTAGEFANIWISKYNGSRGQTTGDYSSQPTLSVDSKSVTGTATTGAGQNAPVEGLGGTVEALQLPEVQQIVDAAQSSPEEALKVAKEVLAGKPVDPMVKALIEALVKVGERA